MRMHLDWVGRRQVAATSVYGEKETDLLEPVTRMHMFLASWNPTSHPGDTGNPEVPLWHKLASNHSFLRSVTVIVGSTPGSNAVVGANVLKAVQDVVDATPCIVTRNVHAGTLLQCLLDQRGDSYGSSALCAPGAVSRVRLRNALEADCCTWALRHDGNFLLRVGDDLTVQTRRIPYPLVRATRASQSTSRRFVQCNLLKQVAAAGSEGRGNSGAVAGANGKLQSLLGPSATYELSAAVCCSTLRATAASPNALFSSDSRASIGPSLTQSSIDGVVGDVVCFNQRAEQLQKALRAFGSPNAVAQPIRPNVTVTFSGRGDPRSCPAPQLPALDRIFFTEPDCESNHTHSRSLVSQNPTLELEHPVPGEKHLPQPSRKVGRGTHAAATFTASQLGSLKAEQEHVAVELLEYFGRLMLNLPIHPDSFEWLGTHGSTEECDRDSNDALKCSADSLGDHRAAAEDNKSLRSAAGSTTDYAGVSVIRISCIPGALHGDIVIALVEAVCGSFFTSNESRWLAVHGDGFPDSPIAFGSNIHEASPFSGENSQTFFFYPMKKKQQQQQSGHIIRTLVLRSLHESG